MAEHVTRPLPGGFSLTSLTSVKHSISLPAVGKVDDDTSCLHFFDLLLHLDFRRVLTDLDSRSEQWITLADYLLLLLVGTQDHRSSCLIRFMAADEKTRTRWTGATASITFILHASSTKVHDGTMKTARACWFESC